MSKRPAKPAVEAPEKRVLVLTHAHPALSRGGAEMSAAALSHAIGGSAGWQTWLMGCSREPEAARAGSCITQPFGDDSYLYSAGPFNWFAFANRDKNFPKAFADMLREIRPDILHFHHYLIFGVDAFLIARQVLPDCKIVLTLHEYQAICNHYGQMIKTGGDVLCYESSPRDCNHCFPKYSRADFFLRQTYIQRFFDLVDQFISPSQFLADRYIAWGLPAAKITILENIVRAAPAEISHPDPAGVLRIGFFGQTTRLKGINVVLNAADMLEDDVAVVFDIHGDDSDQPDEFRAEFAKRRKKAGRNVRFHGAYDNRRVDALMQQVDVVVVPSIWWENSPVVIQEAIRNRRPVICSDLGGMAEKIVPGRDGWHVTAGDANGLAAVVARLAANRAEVIAMVATMRAAVAPQVTVDAHLALYGGLLEVK
jgi:glycosyltransferase involved in cell wall biosynthesis